MSIRIMSAIWDIELPDSEKLVALALADWCNDDGECWPSVPQIAKKCSKSIRTVQGVLSSLETKGVLSRRMVAGKGTFYRLTPAAAAPYNPRSDCTPAKSAPPQGLRNTPAAAAPNTSGTTISSEANASSETRAKAEKDVSLVVSDWNAMAASVGLSQVTKLTDKRKRACLARIREDGLAAIGSAIERIPKSPFLTGQTKDWRADFEFFLRPDSITKINEGKYDRPASRSVPTPSGDRAMGRTEAAGRDALARLAGVANPGTGGQARAAIDGRDCGRPVALPNPDRALRHVAGRQN